MQSNFIKAFRERLRRAGFTEVRIEKRPTCYLVYATDPDGVRHKNFMSQKQIENSPRLVWFS